jgi:membrane associated rhomboid family serine protease
MSNSWQNIQSKVLKSDSKLYLLIGINVVVYLLMLLASSFVGANTFLANDLFLPASLSRLVSHIWTPFTYLFFNNSNIFQILFNMLWLYWMGQLFEDFLGKKRLLGVYILGGLTGAALYILCYNFVPVFSITLLSSVIVGAPACVMAIVVATATLLPDQEVMLLFFRIKLKWLISIYLGLILLYVLANGGSFIAGDYIAQLGGALFGFIYIKQLQKGSDWVGNIANLFKSGPKLSKLKVVARNGNKRTNSRPRQDEVDVILDKISKVGYEHLSSEEKEILFRASKDDN